MLGGRQAHRGPWIAAVAVRSPGKSRVGTKGRVVNSAVAVPINSARSFVQAWRIAVASLAVAILIAVSFLVGHATASPSHTTPTRPALQSTAAPVVVQSLGQPSTFPCRRAC